MLTREEDRVQGINNARTSPSFACDISVIEWNFQSCFPTVSMSPSLPFARNIERADTHMADGKYAFYFPSFVNFFFSQISRLFGE